MSQHDKTRDTRARLEEVEMLQDEVKLVETACTDDSPRVRVVAVSKVNDDQKLLEIATNAKELDARLVAIEKISSERLVAEILRGRNNLELIGMCFSRITDRELIRSIAEDTTCSAVVRRLAVEHFADESYLAEAYEAKTGRKSEKAVDAIVEWHGGGLRGVRAIGRFKGSPKALKALGTVARKGGEAGELAVEYLCKALGSANPELVEVAADELAALSEPDLIATMVLALDDPRLGPPIRDVLSRIGTKEACAALERVTPKR